MNSLAKLAAQQRPSIRSLAAATFLLAGASTAFAANVALTSTLNMPSSGTTLTPLTFSVKFGNSQPGSSTPATNAAIALNLPANLYDISVANVVSTGGAI